MKKLGLYYVFDRIDDTAITPVITSTNDLTAALGFRNAYIANKQTKLNYQSLQLVHFGQVFVDEEGRFTVDVDFKDKSIIQGSDIMTFIQSEMTARGIKDDFLEEDKEE